MTQQKLVHAVLQQLPGTGPGNLTLLLLLLLLLLLCMLPCRAVFFAVSLEQLSAFATKLRLLETALLPALLSLLGSLLRWGSSSRRPLLLWLLPLLRWPRVRRKLRQQHSG
jgi:hypothetical protein